MDLRQAALLDVMGLPRYVRRGGPNDLPPSSAANAAEAAVVSIPTPSASSSAVSHPVGKATIPRIATPVVPATVVPAPVDTPDRSGLDWESLERAVIDCTRCSLCQTRTQTVFGTGDRAARWLVVGEAPGADEDRQGEPFVGRAGQLLNAMLAAIDKPRTSVYIANVLKCRPPANRDPLPTEVQQCLPNLQRQIELVAPELILCVGRTAAQNLLGVDAPLAQLRGKVHLFGPTQRPVVVTYHPAYLLRTPGEKRKAWADLKFALEVADGRRT